MTKDAFISINGIPLNDKDWKVYFSGTTDKEFRLIREEDYTATFTWVVEKECLEKRPLKGYLYRYDDGSMSIEFENDDG